MFARRLFQRELIPKQAIQQVFQPSSFWINQSVKFGTCSFVGAQEGSKKTTAPWVALYKKTKQDTQAKNTARHKLLFDSEVSDIKNPAAPMGYFRADLNNLNAKAVAGGVPRTGPTYGRTVAVTSGGVDKAVQLLQRMVSSHNLAAIAGKQRRHIKRNNRRNETARRRYRRRVLDGVKDMLDVVKYAKDRGY